VRSERLPASDPAFAARVRSLGAGPPVVSSDGHAVALPLVTDEDGIEAVVARVAAANGDGFAVHIAGEETLSRDFTVLSESDLNKGELRFGLPAALIVLLLVVGTLVGASVPMLMAVISIIVALGVTAVVGQFFELNLFITNMVVAGTATRAVVFSGTSFVLAMSAMLLVPDTTLRSLGLGAVVVGLVSIAVALTFHPALLMLLGDRVERGRRDGPGERRDRGWREWRGGRGGRGRHSLRASVDFLEFYARNSTVAGRRRRSPRRTGARS
jgi:RND superfamily putative drug exporter